MRLGGHKRYRLASAWAKVRPTADGHELSVGLARRHVISIHFTVNTWEYRR